MSSVATWSGFKPFCGPYTAVAPVGPISGLVTSHATWIGGNAGSVQVGAVGSNANFYVGRTLAGGGNATGTVDLGGMTSLTAYLNTLSVGTANTGSATGCTCFTT